MSHLTVFVYSRLAGIDFCSTPWGHLQHGVDGFSMFKFIGGDRYGPYISLSKENAQGITVLKADRIMQYPNADRHDSGFVSSVRSIARRHYLSSSATKPPLKYFDDRYINVAIHVRRGDIMNKHLFGSKYEFRTIHDKDYLSCARGLVEHLNSTSTISGTGRLQKRLAFHIFSDGLKEDLHALSLGITRLNVGGSPTTLHLNSLPSGSSPSAVTQALKLTFHHLVNADILIISRSSLSQAAAFLREFDVNVRSGAVVQHSSNFWERKLTLVPAAFGYSPHDTAIPHSGGALWGDIESMISAISC